MTQTQVPFRGRAEPPPPSSLRVAPSRSTSAGPLERLGQRLSGWHPAAAAAAVGVAGFAVLTTLMLGLGLLLTRVLSHGPVGRWDRSVDRWFAGNRTPTLDDVTAYGSSAANTETVIGIGLLVVVIVALRRHWRAPVLLAVGLGVEVTVFLATTFLVDRPRPPVERLDTVPPTASFPSGHTAAAVVLYIGLAILCSRACRNAALCALAWVAGILLPVAVGLARIYRGMHHPTDVMSGVVLGFACLAVALVAVRIVAPIVERRRHAGELQEASS